MSDTFNNTLDVVRTTPRTYSFTKPFWEATRDKKVMLQYCPQTGQYQFFPRPVSVFTGKTNLEWREVKGLGEVFTYTVAIMARPPFSGETPFLIATITLDEGVNMVSNVINCAVDQIAIGMRVKPAWIPLPDGTNLLVFEPEGEG
ncbi:MAG TPA: Zn-ribbon domain-containing OB-fold protein [Novosphingobium sp.]|nr:Zn-ribbon domain-containing OB-fold protein [Novosphingobium sp.]